MSSATKSAPRVAKSEKLRHAKRRPFPYQKVAKLWAAGKTIAQIAEAIGRVGTGKDRYHSLRVFLSRMHHGYKDASGKLVKLPHRVSAKTLRLSRKAGRKAVG